MQQAVVDEGTCCAALHPAVRSSCFPRRMLDQFPFRGLRIDAAGHVEPNFWPWFVNATGVRGIFLPAEHSRH